MSRRDFLKLPIEERRKILEHQVTLMFDNIPDSERIEELHNLD
jgi:ABC-type antimicrobial peptide transport system ATPase subunit